MPKLRVASYYESRLGRNDGNPLYMWRTFGQMPGVESGHLVPTGDITSFGQWDLHFEADWAEDAVLPLLPYKVLEIPHPSAFWASDTHLGFDWRLEHSRKFDHVFCAQKRAVEEFAAAGVKAEWLPHAVLPEAYPAIASIKKFDVCFVGHVNSDNRIDALDRLFREFPNFWYGQRLFEEAAEVYASSKIVFNVSIKDDLNMRVFEALGTRSFLLTNEIPTLGELFQDGVHLATYKDLPEMIEKARYYLAHDEERERIAQAGYDEVIAKHTFRHRAEKVLDVCIPNWREMTQTEGTANAQA